MVNDSGVFTDGTAIDKAFVDQIYGEIDGQNHSSTNPTIKPNATTDEVVTARGSKLSLDARLDISLNEDGTLKSQASLLSIATAQTAVGAKNICQDSLLMLWPDGDTSAPNGWTLSGAGAAIVRTGAGGGGYEASAPADTTKMKFGKFAAKITRGAADAKLTKTLVATTQFPTGLQGRKVSAVVRAKSSVASQCSFVIDDGVTTTRGGFTGNGTFHTGGGTEELLYVTHTLSGSATKIDIYLEVAGSGAAYFGDICVVISDVVPSDWFSERWEYLTIHQKQTGNVTVVNAVNDFRQILQAPGFYVNTFLRCKTAPATQAIIARPAKNAATYPYTTLPQIAVGQTSGFGGLPNGTYANRCFKALDIVLWDITQAGAAPTGDELNIDMVFIVPYAEFDLLGV